MQAIILGLTLLARTHAAGSTVSGVVIDDFQLMNRAAIHIMANSTFSWWAAYLNPNPAARIMGPKYWYGHQPEYQFEAPDGIMHPAWAWVETQPVKVEER